MAMKTYHVATCCLSLLAGCNNRSFIVVDVESGAPVIATTLNLTLSNAAHVGRASFSRGGAPFSLPQTFSLLLDDSRTGDVTVTVEAVGADGKVESSASSVATIVPKGDVRVTIQLKPRVADMGVDMMTADAAPPAPDMVRIGVGFVSRGPAYTVQHAANMATADFNLDGKSDVGIISDDSVFLFAGHGDGTLDSKGKATLQGSLQSIAVADFNMDGKPDIAATEDLLGSSAVYSVLGNGDFTFGSMQAVKGVGRPSLVASADFNGDHIADLVFLDSPNNLVRVLIGTGGTFKPAISTMVTGLQSGALAAGDVTGDQVPDVIVAHADHVAVYSPFPGGLTPAGDYFVSGPVALALADLNGDGKLDIVATTSGGRVSVLVNNGGGFAGAVSYVAGNDPAAVGIADFNADSFPDVAVLASADGTVVLLPGKGDGTLGAPMPFATGLKTPEFFSIADFNGDQYPDLAIASGFENKLVILLNQ